MLDVEHLEVSYGDVPVVVDAGIRVDVGEVVAVIGSNGAGKTSLLAAICGLVPARSGTVTFAGRAITGLPAFRVARLGIAYVPAARHLFLGMTVASNLALGAHPGKPDPQLLDTVFDLFPRLAERRRQRAGTMSGGEQQMLAVGRALMSRPRLLVLDEPTTGLAPILAEQAYEALARLRDHGDLTVLLAEQQVPLALGLADRGYVLEDGRIRLEGTALELRNDPGVRHAYLGIG